MLQLIRDRAQGLVVWTIVGLIIITFALFGLSSYLSGTAKVNVASINDVDISQTEFLRAYQNYQERLKQMLGKSYNPAMFNEKVVKQQVLDGLVTREVLTQALDASGFTASKEQILSKIMSIDSFKDETGKFSNKQYKRTLALQGLNSAMFEQRIAQDIADEQLYSGLMRSVFVTPTELDNYAKLQGQMREIEYLQISHQEFIKSAVVTDSEVEKYYSENSAEFTTPEMVSVEYIELDINEAANQVSIDDAAVRQHYDQNIGQYESTPEQRKASHILITIDSKTDEATAKKTADELLVKIRNGESFAELAKASSKDPGSASKGGDLGFFGKGVMDKAFEDTVFNMKKGDVSEPVKSAFGYHIIKLTDIKAGKITSFKEVKDKIKKELQLQKAEQQFYADIDTLNNLTYETPDSLQPAADALGLKIKQSRLFTRQNASGILANPKIISAAFSKEVLTQGRNSEMIELRETHLLVLRNKEHNPSAPLALEQVKSRIMAILQREKAINQADELAKTILEKLSDGDKPELMALKDKAVKLHKPGLIGRKPDKEDDTISMDIRQAVFRMPKPVDKASIEQVSLMNGDQAVIIFTRAVDGKSTEKTDQQKLLTMYGNAGYENYIAYLKSKADIKLYTENIVEQ